MKKRLIALAIVVALIIVIFGGIFGFKHTADSNKAAMMSKWVMPPAEVTASKSKMTDWQPVINATGQAVAIQSVNVTSQGSGLVTSISFKAGDFVKKGQELFRLDTSQLNAQLDQAKAQMQLSEITYKRDQKLYTQKAVSSQQLDQSLASYNADKANVESIQANIDYRIIKAPFSGKIGLRNISLGQYFEPGSAAATLTQVAPIYIDFPVSQNYISQLKIGSQISFTSDSYPGHVFTADITALNSEISDNTRAIEVQATYDNKDDKYMIYPGMYVDVRVMLPKLHDVIVIPRNAISYTLYGENVMVLDPVMENGSPVIAKYSSFKDGKMEMISTGKPEYKVKQILVTSQMTRDNAVVVKGIKADELVATSGQNKLENGSNVIVNNDYNFKNNP